MESKTVALFRSDWDLVQVVVDRENAGVAFDLTLTYRREGDSKTIQLGGCRDNNIVDELLDAEWIEIYHDASSQRVFGQFRLECHGETFAEFLFDTLGDGNGTSS